MATPDMPPGDVGYVVEIKGVNDRDGSLHISEERRIGRQDKVHISGLGRIFFKRDFIRELFRPVVFGQYPVEFAPAAD